MFLAADDINESNESIFPVIPGCKVQWPPELTLCSLFSGKCHS